MYVYKKDEFKVPIKTWIPEDLYLGDPDMVKQCENLARLPFAFHHLALCRDGHVGYGMPIGGVLATRRVVIPNAVGVDMGCGVCAARTNLTEIDQEQLKQIMGNVRELVPVGFNHHTENQLWDGFDQAPNIPIIQQELNSARKQLGTLGGGNHFWEVQKGSDGFIWFMIHSGSRNFGLKIAKTYNEKALTLCERWYSNIPDKDLAFLPIESDEAKEYLDAMNYALHFAKANRLMMFHATQGAFIKVVPWFQITNFINVHHNYAAWEHHYSEDVIVHRKGAIRARIDDIGIIPGSQGTSSYIVKGKGNPESFTSCSHGAGRKMGRKQASRELNLEEEIKKLDDQGIIHGIRNVGDLDEATGAYKSIDEVMADQTDLVEIITKLSPLAVIKG